MGLGYTIREYQEKDRVQIERISWQVQEWEKRFYPERALSKEIIARHIDRLMEITQNQKGVILVAVVNDKPVGYAAGSVHNDFLNTEPAFYVKDMGVDETSRGKGIGTALLGELERIAKDKYQMTKIMIAVICGNDGAGALYKRMGFVPYELELIKSI